MTRVLVFGKTGQLARCLALSTPSNVDATFLGRDGCDFAGNPNFGERIDQHKPDIVINAVAYTAVEKAETEADLAFAINGRAPALLGLVCATRDIPIIHFSTDYVFSGTAKRPYVETDPICPSGQYGASKLAGEVGLLGSGARSYVFRTAWVYSAFGNNFLKTMIRLGRERGAVSVVNDQFGDPTSAADLAQATWKIIPRIISAAAPRSGIYHLSGRSPDEQKTSWYDFARVIFDAAAELGMLDGVICTAIPSSEYPSNFKRPEDCRLANEKFAEVFGFTLGGWRSSTQRTIQDLKTS